MRLVQKTNIPRLVLTMGEPAGVGPELLVRIAQMEFDTEIVVLANAMLLEKNAEILKLPLSLSPMDWNKSPVKHQKSNLFIETVELQSDVIVGQPDSQNSIAILRMLQRAGELALSNKVDAVVTAPVQKAILNQVDSSFLGHTEFFASQAGKDKVVMMLATEALRMALVTTHIALSKVSTTIDQQLIIDTVMIIHNSFCQLGLDKPKIAICGINPHAGENGLLGGEDKYIVEPAVDSLQKRGINADGPFPSDSLFTKAKRQIYDVFLAMYHDQGLPVVKAIGFGQCANITLGLPYIRTSVDHGTALDIASQRIASADSLEYAIRYAIQLAKGKLPK